MKRLRGSLLALALAGLAGGAQACLNDVELPGREREFRSQYALIPGLQEPEKVEPAPDHDGLLMIAGAALLAGAFGLAVLRDRETATIARPAPERPDEAFDLEERRDPVEV